VRKVMERCLGEGWGDLTHPAVAQVMTDREDLHEIWDRWHRAALRFIKDHHFPSEAKVGSCGSSVCVCVCVPALDLHGLCRSGDSH
jgi:hypothetical protein